MYLIQSFDICSMDLWILPFTKEMLSDQFNYIFLTSKVKHASA